MAHCLDAFRHCAISSPIWKPHHASSEANLIFTRTPFSSSGKLQSEAALTTVMATRCRRWWQGITSGKASCNVKAALCMSARANINTVWERVAEDYEEPIHTEKCRVRCGSTVPALRWRLLWRKLRARMNWMKSSCIACPQDRPLNDLLYDPVSYALNFDNGGYTAPYPHPY